MATFGKTTQGVFVAALAAVLVAPFALGVARLDGQQPSATFRAATRLVEVTVTVVDKKGNAVAGLGASDFVVLDGGKPQPVALVRFDGAPATAPRAPGEPAPGAAERGIRLQPDSPAVAAERGARLQPDSASDPAVAAPAPGTFTNRPGASDPASRNVTALVLDNINTTPLQGVTARALMMRYLRTLAPQTLTAVYLLGDHLYVLHDFTDDAAALRERLEHARLPSPTAWDMDGRQAVVEAEAFVSMFPAEERAAAVELMQSRLRVDAMADAAIRRNQMERSLAEMQALGRHLAGIPGRKSLVWIGGGFSMVSVTASVGGRSPTPELLETNEEQVRQVSRRLAQQGIVLYIVDAAHIQAPSDTRPQSRQAVPMRGRGNFELFMETATVSSDTKAAMQTMASITGGRYFYPNDTTSGVDKVMGDLRGSYTIGFYMPEHPDGKWHRLRVRVARPGVTVRHREGYFADARRAEPETWTDERWRAELSNPLGSTAIPLTATCTWTPSGELAMTVLADTAALQFLPDGDQVRANLEVLIGDRTAEGFTQASRSAATTTVPAAQWEASRQQAARYERTWKPGPSATVVRVIVRDANSGLHGSLDLPLSKVPRDAPR